MNKVRKSRNNSVKLRRRSRNIKRKQRRTNKRIKRYSKRRMSKRRMTKRINQKKRSVKKQRGGLMEWQCKGTWEENGEIVKCGNYWKVPLSPLYKSRWCSARTGDGTDERVNNTSNRKNVDYMGQSLAESKICDNGPLAGRYREQRFQWKSGYCPECWENSRICLELLDAKDKKEEIKRRDRLKSQDPDYEFKKC